jgi:hypothetical protein
VLATACAHVERYRLTDSGAEWRTAGRDALLEDLAPRYPDFFEVVLDPQQHEDPPILALRDDIEADGDGRERFDALNAVAIAYFEFNSRAQRGLEDDSQGAHYFSDSFRATKLLSIPWRAYADIEDPALRDAIVDFYTDIARGGKRDAATTAPRVTRLVVSLEDKEPDAERKQRIRALAADLIELEDASR